MISEPRLKYYEVPWYENRRTAYRGLVLRENMPYEGSGRNLKVVLRNVTPATVLIWRNLFLNAIEHEVALPCTRGSSTVKAAG